MASQLQHRTTRMQTVPYECVLQGYPLFGDELDGLLRRHTAQKRRRRVQLTPAVAHQFLEVFVGHGVGGEVEGGTHTAGTTLQRLHVTSQRIVRVVVVGLCACDVALLLAEHLPCRQGQVPRHLAAGLVSSELVVGLAYVVLHGGVRFGLLGQSAVPKQSDRMRMFAESLDVFVVDLGGVVVVGLIDVPHAVDDAHDGSARTAVAVSPRQEGRHRRTHRRNVTLGTLTINGL
mmetsp:Transcript_39369/g.98489  ORF Transcript_39369/g.98489 Transcript_39369/m.98489 type:complete len:232 (+) Transcript_39369:404-1099(+)